MSVDSLSTNPRRATLAVTAGAVIGALGVAIVVLLLATIATGVVSAADLIVAIEVYDGIDSHRIPDWTRVTLKGEGSS